MLLASVTWVTAARPWPISCSPATFGSRFRQLAASPVLVCSRTLRLLVSTLHVPLVRVAFIAVLLLLHDDPSIERPEKIKPILSVNERTMILNSLKQVDRIITYETESDLYEILMKENINVRFLGDDYRDKSFTGDDLDIPIHYLDRSHGWSTTKFKKLIAKTL